ncbi:MAG TPA: AsmA family protein [Pseudorhodoplanes sp.]|nr:AsmA family protein [Pseudorhodoplanes sp.]
MPAITGLKRLGIALFSLVAILFGILAAVSFLMPADHVRDAVKAEIRSVTGLDLVLRGPTSVSLFPSGSVTFSNVALGGGDGSPLVAEQLVARLRFFPLLAGRIDVSDVQLINPRVTIAIGQDGRTNWSPLVEALTENFRASRESLPMNFSEIQFVGGRMEIRNETTGVTDVLSDVEMSLALPAISKSFVATGTFNWHGEPVEASVTLSDFATALRGDKSGLKVRLTGAPAKLAFDGSFSMKPRLKVDGSLAADAASLRRLLTWTGQKPLPGGGFGRFSLKAQTNIVGGTIALTAVNLELDGNAAEGVLTFATDGRQTWQGTLAADSLDLTPYVSTIRLITANEREWSRLPFDVEGLSNFDLDLRLSAANVAIGSAKLGRTAIAANMRGGKLTITVGESIAFGGVIKGSLSLAQLGEGAEMKTQLAFTNVDLESCIGELFGIRRIEGKGDLAIALDGSGSTVLELTRTLNGNLSMEGRQGALTGLNVEQLLRRLERRPLSGGNEFRTGRTPFEKLSVQIKVAQGVATADVVSLEGPAVKLALVGSASIPARDLDLKGTASLIDAANGQGGFDLPFVVQGPWDDPIMLPDPQILIRRSGAAAPLLDRLRDQRARDAVRSAIEKLSGGKLAAPAPEEPAEKAPAQ